MTMLGGVPIVPSDADAEKLADWAELFVIGREKDTRKGDFRSYLSREGVSDDESASSAIWVELERRDSQLGDRWPLRVSNGKLAPRWRHDSFYVNIFLAALSLHGPGVHASAPAIFEALVAELVANLSRDVAERLIPGTQLKAKPSASGSWLRSAVSLPGPRETSLWLAGACCPGGLSTAVSALIRRHRTTPLQIEFVAVPEFVPDSQIVRATTDLQALTLDRGRLLTLKAARTLTETMKAPLANFCRGLYE